MYRYSSPPLLYRGSWRKTEELLETSSCIFGVCFQDVRTHRLVGSQRPLDSDLYITLSNIMIFPHAFVA